MVRHDEDVGRQDLWTLEQLTFSIFHAAHISASYVLAASSAIWDAVHDGNKRCREGECKAD